MKLLCLFFGHKWAYYLGPEGVCEVCSLVGTRENNPHYRAPEVENPKPAVGRLRRKDLNTKRLTEKERKVLLAKARAWKSKAKARAWKSKYNEKWLKRILRAREDKEIEEYLAKGKS